MEKKMAIRNFTYPHSYILFINETFQGRVLRIQFDDKGSVIERVRIIAI